MPKITESMRIAVLRKRGELNLNYRQLEKATGISHWTLSDVLNGKRTSVHTRTLNQLNEWLYKQI